MTSADTQFPREQEKLNKIIKTFFGVNSDTTITVDSIKKELANLGLLLAGGTINSIFSGRDVSDLDLYIRDASKIEEAKKFLETHFKLSFISNNATSYSRHGKSRTYEVQLITRFTGEPQTILDTFDFTIVQGLYDFQECKFIISDEFLTDIGTRTLRFTGTSQYPICALYRTKKYQARGYTLSGATIMHIALSIVRLEIKTYAELKDQIAGIDTMHLIGFLENLDNTVPVDYAYFIEHAMNHIDGFEHTEYPPPAPRTSRNAGGHNTRNHVPFAATATSLFE